MAKKKNTAAEEIIRVDGEIKKRENRYYAKIADIYRTFGFLIILLMVILGGALLIKYGEYITYDNFVYLLRDFDSVTDKEANYTEVVYTAQDQATFEPFRDGFAVIGSSSVTIFDRTGVELCSETESLSYPAAASGEKYLMVYDIGGKSYSLYNSVTRVIKGETEKPIISASVSDDGSYILTTESDDAKYVTEVYNSAFRRTMSIYKDKYVIDSAISRDGDTFVIASISESGAEFSAEVSFYKAGDVEESKVYAYSMSMPLAVSSLDGDNFAVLCDDAIRFYDADGNVKSETLIGGEDVSYYDARPTGAILICKANTIGTENRVYTFDNEGNILYSGMISERVSGAAFSVSNSETAGYLLSTDSVIEVRFDGAHLKHYPEGDILCLIDTSAGPLALTPERGIRFNAEKEHTSDSTSLGNTEATEDADTEDGTMSAEETDLET